MEQYNDSEWKTDEHGERYRELGRGMREYEMMIHTQGMEIPQSQLEEFNRRNREQQEAELQRQREEMAHRKPVKMCPFSTGLSTACKTDCAFYTEQDGCRLAAHPGQPTEGKKCPFNNRVCKGECAMYKDGCTLPAV